MANKPQFKLPGPEDRVVVIGGTGTGKTVFGAWVLSRQNFHKRPWVLLDFKGEELWDDVGDPPLRPLKVGQMPGKRGVYRMRVNPWDTDDLEEWLKDVWSRGNIGIFVDEVSLVPQKDAFKAILRQGRSKLIPVIACTQRPVGCDREVFTESQYRALFSVEDKLRDYPVVKGLFGDVDVRPSLPRHHCYWYDVKQRMNCILKPCPAPDILAKDLRQSIPYGWYL